MKLARGKNFFQYIFDVFFLTATPADLFITFVGFQISTDADRKFDTRTEKRVTHNYPASIAEFFNYFSHYYSRNIPSSSSEGKSDILGVKVDTLECEIILLLLS